MAKSKNEGWYVISLRPRGAHGPLRSAAARRGWQLLALSPWRIDAREDAGTRADLAQALAAERVIFTSPAAVDAAARLQPLRGDGVWLAVGAGTAQRLQRHGRQEVHHPARMDSEGLLDLPELQDVQGKTVGFVSAPDGRNVIAPTLQARGAQIVRAEVYARVDLPLPAERIARLRAIAPRACLLLSSEGALQRVLAQLPDDARAQLLRVPVVAASERLAQLAHATGFPDVVVASGPQAASLLAAAATRRTAVIR